MSFVAGVFLAIGAGVLNAIGVIVQKRAHRAQMLKPVHERLNYCCNQHWWLGFLTYVAGNLLNAAALTLAPQSVISPLTSTNLVANSFLAPFFLGETLTHVDMGATCCIICGLVLIVVFGDQASSDYTLDQLLALYNQTQFIVYAALGAFIMVVLYLIVLKKPIQNT